MAKIECPCGFIFDESEQYQECCVGGHEPSCLLCPKCKEWLERRLPHIRYEEEFGERKILNNEY